jgi:hypothetical protein
MLIIGKNKLLKKGFSFADYKPDWRTHTLVKLGKRFGTGMILPVLQGMEQTGPVGNGQVPGNRCYAGTGAISRLLVWSNHRKNFSQYN